MPDRIKIARLSLFVGGGLMIATALLFLFIFVTGAVFIGWGTERADLLGSALLGATGVFLFLLSAAFGVAAIIAAEAIGRGKKWSRPAGIALAAMGLPLFPVGTLLGIFALTGLLSADGRAWFEPGRPPSRPTTIKVRLP